LGLVLDDRPVSEDRRRALADYDQMADLYADDAAVDPIKVSYDRPTIVAMAGDVRGKRVLDVGCASGGLSEAFAERGARVVGIDLNPRLIERARERLGSKAEFRVADIAAPLSFLEAGSFDVVAASLVLHYLADWGPPLREFARILRPRGALLISTHHPIQDVMIATPARSVLRDGAAHRYLAEGRARVPGALLPSSDQRDRRRACGRGLSHRAHPRARS
jgi:2-polyprenyl-3-methyl-5-hydroxy-6-metoxy-1,4-benzoquinol methylase